MLTSNKSGKSIAWKEAKPTQTLWEVCAPDNTSPPDLTFLEAVKNYEVIDKKEGQKIRYTLASLKDKLVSRLTVGNLLKAISHKPAYSHAGTKARVARWIYWLATGKEKEKRERTPFSDSPSDVHTLQVNTHKITDLKKLLPITPEKGRFAELKMSIARLVNEIPPGEFRTVDIEKIEDRERHKIEKSLLSLFQSTYPDWLLIWNPLDRVFVLVRKKDMEKGGK